MECRHKNTKHNTYEMIDGMGFCRKCGEQVEEKPWVAKERKGVRWTDASIERSILRKLSV